MNRGPEYAQDIDISIMHASAWSVFLLSPSISIQQQRTFDRYASMASNSNDACILYFLHKEAVCAIIYMIIFNFLQFL